MTRATRSGIPRRKSPLRGESGDRLLRQPGRSTKGGCASRPPRLKGHSPFQSTWLCSPGAVPLTAHVTCKGVSPWGGAPMARTDYRHPGSEQKVPRLALVFLYRGPVLVSIKSRVPLNCSADERQHAGEE